MQERGAGTASSSPSHRENPADPFIDPEGYRAYIDKAERNSAEGGALERQAKD